MMHAIDLHQHFSGANGSGCSRATIVGIAGRENISGIAQAISMELLLSAYQSGVEFL